jgi:hypothetical protein
MQNLRQYARFSNKTVGPPYPLFQYPQFKLSAVYRRPKKIGKLKK